MESREEATERWGMVGLASSTGTRGFSRWQTWRWLCPACVCVLSGPRSSIISYEELPFPPPSSDPVATAEAPHVPYCDSSEALGALLRFTVGGKSADAIVSLLLCQAKDNISAFHSSFGGKIDLKQKQKKKGHTLLSTALAESQSWRVLVNMVQKGMTATLGWTRICSNGSTIKTCSLTYQWNIDNRCLTWEWT